MTTNQPKLKILVLAGGPDRERPVSLMSGASVASALTQAGHDVRQRDITPDDLSALDEFEQWPGDVVFPMLHGSWGEGGGLQSILEEKGLAFVGTPAAAAELCMDKIRTKEKLIAQGLPTPAYQVLAGDQMRTLPLPGVLKAPREGSSIDLAICRNEEQFRRARENLQPTHAELLLEQFIAGKELTVGVIEGPAGLQALPPIHIIPATEYYDYQAKYDRNDTQYRFDIDLPHAVLSQINRLSLEATKAVGCRHLCRWDFMIDSANRPWILEVNTIPGFTSHSLLPKAAAQAGISLPALVDQLARMAARSASPCGRAAHA